MSAPSQNAGFCHDEPARRDLGSCAHEVALEGDPAMVAAVADALRQVYDPEIPLNIYDLGLVYRVAVDDEGDVAIDMTLTAPSCPVAGMMPLMVKNAVGGVEGVGLITVTMVWEPPWSQDHLSDEALLTLGLF